MEYRTKKDYALALIREKIVAGELEPGTRLRLTDLARHLDISLTPVREALRQLEAEGLVAGTAHRGVRVSTADPAQLRDVYVARRLLEPYAAGCSAERLTDTDVTRARTLLEKLERSHARTDAHGIRRANYDFHFLLYARSGLPVIEQMIKTLWNRFPWDVLSVVPNRMEASKAEHERILDMMGKRDARGLRDSVEWHLCKSYEDIEAHLKAGDGDPFREDLMLGRVELR